jgi:hypothetical protein
MNALRSRYIRIAQALTPEALGGTGIDWLELDIYDPNALRQIRCAVQNLLSILRLVGEKNTRRLC